MGRIDNTLRMRSVFAMGGASFTDEELWTKAFRLKHFGRCPWCDTGVKSWRDVFRGSSEFRCTSCEWIGEIFDTAFHRADDVDDPIIAMVRDALGLGFVVIEPGRKVWLTMGLGLAALAVFVIAVMAIAFSTF